MKRLLESLARAWDDSSNTYRYLDRETHFATPGIELASKKGPSLVNFPEQQFEPAVRLSIRILRQGEGQREADITILGKDKAGNPQKEVFLSNNVRWSLGWGTVISKQVYSQITFVQIDGILDEDQVLIQTIDYRHIDQTLLAPLWAQVPSADRADTFIKRTILHPARFFPGLWSNRLYDYPRSRGFSRF